MSNFNSKQYEWADVTIATGGRVITGAISFETTKKQTKERLMGRGKKAHAIQRGNEEYDCKIGLWQSEYQALEDSSKTGNILDLQLDVTVAYVPEDGGATVVKTWIGVEFTEAAEGMNQGDTHMKVELPGIYLDQKRQA